MTTVGPRLNEFLMSPVTSPTFYSVTQVPVSHKIAREVARGSFQCILGTFRFMTLRLRFLSFSILYPYRFHYNFDYIIL